MVHVGVVGLGMMGQTHLGAYRQVEGAEVVAVADKDASRLAGVGSSAGSFKGQGGGGYDLRDAAKYADGLELIADPNVDMVDLCLVTPLHVPFAVAALEAGKHVLIEKPLARTSMEAKRIVDAEDASPGMAMCAQCMRFWPGWTWLKTAVDDGRYGQLLSAVFTRLGNPPANPFYHDGKLSGGAALDLHIHDTDFVQHLFGVPDVVYSAGYTRVSGCCDHITTIYRYGDDKQVSAEGGWITTPGLGFTMRYRAVFEGAVALFDLVDGEALLTLIEAGKPPANVALPAGQGYAPEIAYFIDCIVNGKRPERSGLRDSARSIGILEAEIRSTESGRPEPVVLFD